MFTGIIQAIGTVRASQARGGDTRLTIDTAALEMASTQLGDSIAVNGVCLTAVELGAQSFAADVSRETLDLTSIGQLAVGSRVNLEKALTPSTPLGGHLVSGHVDGLGTVVESHQDARSRRFTIEAPAELAKYIAKKGSISVDGTSLTVNEIDGARFELNIVPHTLQETIMGDYAAGRRVNLEVDLVARYLERLLLGDKAAESQTSVSGSFAAGTTNGITEALLKNAGFA